MSNTVCSYPECQASHRDHRWGKIKATGWFHLKNGQAWCPLHVPDWVETWRAKTSRK